MHINLQSQLIEPEPQLFEHPVKCSEFQFILGISYNRYQIAQSKNTVAPLSFVWMPRADDFVQLGVSLNLLDELVSTHIVIIGQKSPDVKIHFSVGGVGSAAGRSANQRSENQFSRIMDRRGLPPPGPTRPM
ncbi:MAG: hypothetical protein WA705_08740 [Candidatus Ozemobacteraceae bacterium]